MQFFKPCNHAGGRIKLFLIWIWHERRPDSFLNKVPAVATGFDRRHKTIDPGTRGASDRRDFPPIELNPGMLGESF